jgi:hypothetical protein
MLSLFHTFLFSRSFRFQGVWAEQAKLLVGMLGSEAHPHYLTRNEGTTTKLISPFQVHPGLRASIWKCCLITGLAAMSVVVQKGISYLPSHTSQRKTPWCP